MLNQIFVANGEATMRLWLYGFMALYDAILHKNHMIPTNHWKKAEMKTNCITVQIIVTSFTMKPPATLLELSILNDVNIDTNVDKLYG